MVAPEKATERSAPPPPGLNRAPDLKCAPKTVFETPVPIALFVVLFTRRYSTGFPPVSDWKPEAVPPPLTPSMTSVQSEFTKTPSEKAVDAALAGKTESRRTAAHRVAVSVAFGAIRMDLPVPNQRGGMRRPRT